MPAFLLVEVRSLSSATCRGPGRAALPPFGSGKGAWGHGEAGCGLPSLANLMVTVRQWSLAPNAQLRTLSPHVGELWAGASAALCAQPVEASGGAGGAVGGVSSFGYSGTIAHAVLGFGRGGASVALAVQLTVALLSAVAVFGIRLSGPNPPNPPPGRGFYDATTGTYRKAIEHVDVVGAARCSYPGCNREDYLPIVCRPCGKKFCKEHYPIHVAETPACQLQSRLVISCPYCEKNIVPQGVFDDGSVDDRRANEFLQSHMVHLFFLGILIVNIFL